MKVESKQSFEFGLFEMYVLKLLLILSIYFKQVPTLGKSKDYSKPTDHMSKNQRQFISKKS